MISLSRPTCPNPTALQTDYKNRINKAALKSSSNDKCMYCESKISHIDHAHVEHIKPKAVGKYPELTYAWDNLGYSCAVCNTNKGDKYDVETPYINPYVENPEHHFVAIGAILNERNGCERADLMIIDLKLNRPELLEKRLEKLETIRASIGKCYRTRSERIRNVLLNELQCESETDKEYSLFVKTCLQIHNAVPPV